jgi:hypothetical protein
MNVDTPGNQKASEKRLTKCPETIRVVASDDAAAIEVSRYTTTDAAAEKSAWRKTKCRIAC